MSSEYKVNCRYEEKEGKNLINIDFIIPVSTIKDNEDAVNFLERFVMRFRYV